MPTWTTALLLASLLAQPGAPAAEAPDVEICVDQSNWFPETFAVRGEARGVHADLLRCAMIVANLPYRMRPLPWPRCLRWVALGKLDAAATATYTPERAVDLAYPDDAATALEHSQWAVGYAQDQVVTMADRDYVYRGDMAGLPAPVRVPRGWSIATSLRALGVEVDDGAVGDEDNLQKLLRDRRGSVIATSTSLRTLLQRPEWAKAFRVQSIPLRQRAYHLVFSKASTRLSPEQRQAVWDAIQQVRQNSDLLRAIESRYVQAPTSNHAAHEQASSPPNTTLECAVQTP